MPARASGSASRASTVPSGSAAKASSVGANTVNGPSPLSVSTRPAAVAAASRVLNEPAAAAVSTMSLSMEPAKAGVAIIRAAVAAAVNLRIIRVSPLVTFHSVLQQIGLIARLKRPWISADGRKKRLAFGGVPPKPGLPRIATQISVISREILCVKKSHIVLVPRCWRPAQTH